MGPQNVNGRLLPLHLWQCSSEDDTEMEEDGDGACGNDMGYVPEEESGEESGGEDEVQFENEIWVNTVWPKWRPASAKEVYSLWIFIVDTAGKLWLMQREDKLFSLLERNSYKGPCSLYKLWP